MLFPLALTATLLASTAPVVELVKVTVPDVTGLSPLVTVAVRVRLQVPSGLWPLNAEPKPSVPFGAADLELLCGAGGANAPRSGKRYQLGMVDDHFMLARAAARLAKLAREPPPRVRKSERCDRRPRLTPPAIARPRATERQKAPRRPL